MISSYRARSARWWWFHSIPCSWSANGKPLRLIRQNHRAMSTPAELTIFFYKQMFFFLSWWLVKVESWWITWPWTSIRGFKSLAMTLFFARCRYWNWHQTADKVTGQVLEIDNRQSGAKNKLSDLVFLSGKYHISLTFPRDFGFVWRFSTIAILQ